MNMRILTLFALVLFALCLPARASEPLTKFGVVLLQPDIVLKNRVPEVTALANYIRAVEDAARASFLTNQQHPSTAGFIVVAVRPEQKSKVWLDFDPPLPSALKDVVIANLKAVQPFGARAGAVVFAIKVGIWGGAKPVRTTPSPAEWTAATKRLGRPVETGELVEMIWDE